MKTRRDQFFLFVLACVLTSGGLAVGMAGHTIVGLNHEMQIIESALAITLGGLLMSRITAWQEIQAVIRELRPAGLLFDTVAGGAEFAEAEDVGKFIVELRAGPILKPRASYPEANSHTPVAPDKSEDGDAGAESDPVSNYFSWSPEPLAASLNLVERCKYIEDQQERHDTLAEVGMHVECLKVWAGDPRLRPAWELTTALGALLRQLTDRASNVTNSTLRSIGAGLRLLADVSVPGVRPDLLANPPIRIMAVDDDPVGRFALTASVKKAFTEPELAGSGPLALNLARMHHYDLILLDVVMTGMDGFEVCRAIRAGSINACTPILFVTGLKQVDPRIKLLETAGNDLLGKPYLTLELTLKIYTLVLRTRLRDCNDAPENCADRGGRNEVNGAQN